MPYPSKEPIFFADVALARRLEKAEAQSNMEFVETRARIFPESNSQWIEVAGAYAMYDGVSSPLTQSFGLGLFRSVTREDMDLIEGFYRQHDAPVFHEVSPLADTTLLEILNQRHYKPIEFTSVMFLPIRQGLNFSSRGNELIKVRLAQPVEKDIWAHTAGKGWSEFPELAQYMLEIGEIIANKPGELAFFAEIDGHPVATGALSLCEGVGLLAGASTIPEGRKRGAQLALLDARLRYAAEHGCDIAMMCARPGSASQRNAERHGFRIAYTRVKWQLTTTAE